MVWRASSCGLCGVRTKVNSLSLLAREIHGLAFQSRVETPPFSMCGCLVFCGGPRKSFNPPPPPIPCCWSTLFVCYTRRRYTRVYIFTKIMIMDLLHEAHGRKYERQGPGF